MGRRLTNGEAFSDPTGLRTTRIPVDLSALTPVRLRAYALPVQAGDYLRIHAELDVTNDAGRPTATGIRYTVGIGAALWWYNPNLPTTPVDLRADSWRLIASRGMNCTVDMHHLAMCISGELTIPDDWEPDRQVGIALRVDAHSTQWNANSKAGGDYVTAEDRGELSVIRYRD